MERKKNPLPTQRFKIKFSPLIIALCCAVLVLCGLGIGISVWRIYTFGIKTFTDVLKYPFLIAVCVFGIALVVSLLIRSQYVVDDKFFITQYGFIKSKFAVSDITSALLDRDAQKLTVYFGEPYAVLSVAPEWNEALVRALLAVNPNIDYGFTLADPPTNTNEK